MDAIGTDTALQSAIIEPARHAGSALQSLHWTGALKRGIDLALSTALLLFCLPLLAVLALLICLDSPGPAIYRARRVGRDGKIFWCFKLRTMVTNADQLRSALACENQRDAILFKIENDPRITRLGRILRKYSADELAQLWNVLKGDMSLVGPRPGLPEEVAQYKREYLERLTVMPGITGLWQVNARKDPSCETYFRLDTEYVRNWNLWLDFTIMVRTIRVVLSGTGQ
jgi:lipopolysaccharide/colanic/teichoic acid biosynthesis glycosyltransferase